MRTSHPFRSVIFAFFLLASAAPLAAGHWPQPPERTGMLYLAGWQSDNLGEYLPDGTLVRTFTAPGMDAPRGVAVDLDGNLIVVCEQSASILRLDLEGNLLETITHPELTTGTGIAQSPNGDWYVGNSSPGRVLVFDQDWNHKSTLSQVGMAGVNCVSFDPDGSFAVSAANTNSIFLFDAAHNHLGTVTHPEMGSPMSIALDSLGDHYVSQGNTGVVIKFDADWNALFSFGSGTLSSPQAVIVDEHDVLTVTDFSVAKVRRFDTAGNLIGEWDLSGVTTARNGGFQTAPQALARAGSVNHANGYPEAVLRVNGSTGDSMGRTSMGAADPLQIELDVSSAGPDPASFVLFGHLGDPGAAEVEVLPEGLGWFAFGTPLTGAAPTTLVNSVGYAGLLGAGMFSSVQAPAIAVDLPAGAQRVLTMTFQAVIEDDGSDSAATLPYSATNAVVVSFH